MEAVDLVLEAARRAPTKEQDLRKHTEAITTLRDKGYTWREVAAFLNEHGVVTDHTKLLRFMQKYSEFKVPPADEYVRALTELRSEGKLEGHWWTMLAFHYGAHNRTVTYTQLAKAAEANGAKVPAERPHSYANLQYGLLAKAIGTKLGMKFLPSASRAEPFYSSAIGLDNPAKAPNADYELVMHHELAKALQCLEASPANGGDPSIITR